MLEDDRQRLWRKRVDRTKGVPGKTNLSKDAGSLDVEFLELLPPHASIGRGVQEVKRNKTHL